MLDLYGDMHKSSVKRKNVGLRLQFIRFLLLHTIVKLSLVYQTIDCLSVSTVISYIKFRSGHVVQSSAATGTTKQVSDSDLNFVDLGASAMPCSHSVIMGLSTGFSEEWALLAKIGIGSNISSAFCGTRAFFKPRGPKY